MLEEIINVCHLNMPHLQVVNFVYNFVLCDARFFYKGPIKCSFIAGHTLQYGFIFLIMADL